MTEFQHRITFAPAFDKRNPDDPSKDYGVHGAEAHFALIGPAGAITFTLYTGWHLPEVIGKPEMGIGGFRYGKALVEQGHYPMPAMVSYHSPVQVEDYEQGHDACEWIGGAPCFGDGTFICDDAFEALIRGGTDGLWKHLEGWYESRLEGREQNG